MQNSTVAHLFFARDTFERQLADYEASGCNEEAWQLVQDIVHEHRSNIRRLPPLLIEPWLERLLAGYEARGCDEEAWQLVQDMFHEHQKIDPMYRPTLSPWTERILAGYKARGCDEEAWQLVQNTFHELCSKMPLFAPDLKLWIKRMVAGYEERGCDEEAWQLVRDTFQEHRSNIPDIMPSSIEPWLQQIAAGYEARGFHAALLELYKDLLVPFLQGKDVLGSVRMEQKAQAYWEIWPDGASKPAICDLPNFPELVEEFFASPRWGGPPQIQKQALIRYIQLKASRKVLIALIQREIPGELRKVLSNELRSCRSAPPDSCIVVGDAKFDVHRDVLACQSRVFRAQFGGRFTNKPTFELDDSIVSKRSWSSLSSTIYGSVYVLPEDYSEIKEDIDAADYLDVVHLLERDLSDHEIRHVNFATRAQT